MKIWAEIADTINHKKCPDSQIVFFQDFRLLSSRLWNNEKLAESIPFFSSEKGEKERRVRSQKRETNYGERVFKSHAKRMEVGWGKILRYKK